MTWLWTQSITLSMLQRLGRIGYGSLSQLQVHNKIWTHTLAVFPGLHPASWYIPYSRKLSRKKNYCELVEHKISVEKTCVDCSSACWWVWPQINNNFMCTCWSRAKAAVSWELVPTRSDKQLHMQQRQLFEANTRTWGFQVLPLDKFCLTSRNAATYMIRMLLLSSREVLLLDTCHKENFHG